MNHLGVEVESVTDVDASASRLAEAGLATFDEKDTTCCFALQDKVWVHDPAGAPWEIYTIKDDDPAKPRNASDDAIPRSMNDGGCCTIAAGETAEDMPATAGACCCCSQSWHDAWALRRSGPGCLSPRWLARGSWRPGSPPTSDLSCSSTRSRQSRPSGC